MDALVDVGYLEEKARERTYWTVLPWVFTFGASPFKLHSTDATRVVRVFGQIPSPLGDGGAGGVGDFHRFSAVDTSSEKMAMCKYMYLVAKGCNYNTSTRACRSSASVLSKQESLAGSREGRTRGRWGRSFRALELSIKLYARPPRVIPVESTTGQELSLSLSAWPLSDHHSMHRGCLPPLLA